MLKQELAPLESSWKLLSDGLLNDIRSRKSGARVGLCDVDITQ
jgi:hypothetical protein